MQFSTFHDYIFPLHGITWKFFMFSSSIVNVLHWSIMIKWANVLHWSIMIKWVNVLHWSIMIKWVNVLHLRIMINCSSLLSQQELHTWYILWFLFLLIISPSNLTLSWREPIPISHNYFYLQDMVTIHIFLWCAHN